MTSNLLELAKRAAIAVGAVAVALAALDYAYFHGFDDGADASLCVTALAVESQAEALQEPSCQRIKGRKALPRIFPGTNGDEPTIWTRARADGAAS